MGRCGCFFRCGIGLLVSWLIFYGCMAIVALLRLHGVKVDDPGVTILINALYRLPILMILMLLCTIRSGKIVRSAAELPWLPWFLVVLVLTFLDVVAQLYSDEWASGPLFVQSGTSLVEGVGIAMLVGRFDSRLIPAPMAVIPLLYIYAAIQTLFALTPGHAELYLITLLVAALLLKGLLFLFVSWLLQEGVLDYFLSTSRNLEAESLRKLREFQGEVQQIARPNFLRGPSFSRLPPPAP